MSFGLQKANAATRTAAASLFTSQLLRNDAREQSQREQGIWKRAHHAPNLFVFSLAAVASAFPCAAARLYNRTASVVFLATPRPDSNMRPKT
jgi:hypothetical protein